MQGYKGAKVQRHKGYPLNYFTMKRILFLFFLLTFFNSIMSAQESGENKAERMQWFKDAKLGIFIHWGIYAVNGIDESWSFYNGYISHADYMKQLKGFTASKYDPDSWASLINESGAKYAVLTSKHHDGVALWNSKAGDLNVVRKTPASKDLVAPFCDALRKQGMKVGLYYSLLDWSYSDYPNFTKTEKRYTDDPARWDKFTVFNHTQITELEQKLQPRSMVVRR